MIENNIDIVHIHYSYDEQTLKKSFEELSKIMMEDIDQVISTVLFNGDYKETIFWGKSLGTIPIANSLMKREEYLNSKMILFTPLLNFGKIFDPVLRSQHKGLLVIGDRDPHYNAENINRLTKVTNLKIEVVQDANHSLDIVEFDTSKSINAVSKIMKNEKRSKYIIKEVRKYRTSFHHAIVLFLYI